MKLPETEPVVYLQENWLEYKVCAWGDKAGFPVFSEAAITEAYEKGKRDAVPSLTEDEILEIARVQSNSIAVNRNHDFILRFAIALLAAAPKEK